MIVGRGVSRFLILAAASLPAFAAYHYVHYNGRNAPFNPIYERFGVSTVSFFVSDQSPAIYAPNDSFGSVLSQVKQAVAAWNSIPSSDLKVEFGGLETPNQSSATPGGDVIFVDLPPGLLGLGAPTTSTVPVNGPNGPYYPILRGVVQLSRDTNRGAGPSYFESFYTTAVHEIGHALGLQHTWTASAMSQDVIRNTSRARPLDADDVASFLVLYGKPGWQSNYGAVTGRVTYANGQPAALASVVALTPAGPAVSTLTDPNGNYRIDGLPPNGNYIVYAHPLPPDAIQVDGSGLQLPVDQNRIPFPATGPFQTLFYPGTLDPNQAAVITAAPGVSREGINFTVQPRTSLPTYNVVTWSKLDPVTRNHIVTDRPGTQAVTPAFISSANNLGLVIVQPPSATPLPQSATLLGGFGNALQISAFQFLDGRPPAFALFFSMPIGIGVGPRHLVLNFGTDIYVLPGAVNVVRKGPPVIQSVFQNADGTITLAGAGLGPDSTIYFDGLQAPAQGPFIGTDAQGSMVVTPPQGGSGQVAAISVYNSDGQNSMTLQSINSLTYTYQAIFSPQIVGVSPNTLPAGASASVDITTNNTNFLEGQVTVGFGSDDVVVRRIWILGPNHLIANVAVASGAPVGFSEVSVISGMQVMALQGGFLVQAPRAGLPSVSSIVNNETAQATVYPGSVGSIYGQNLQAGAVPVQVTLNDVPVQLQFASANQINFFVPPGAPAGPAKVIVNNGAQVSFPWYAQIDAPPPVIVGVANSSNVPAAGIAMTAGEVLNISVTGLDPSITLGSPRLRVLVSGVEMPIVQITPPINGIAQIQIVLKQSFGGSQTPLTVWVDGSGSSPFSLLTR